MNNEATWISPISALLGVLVGFILEWLRGLILSSRKQRNNAKAIYIEITINHINLAKGIDGLNKLLNDFQEVLSTGSTSSHPGLLDKSEMIDTTQFDSIARELLSFPTCVSAHVISLYAVFKAIKIDLKLCAEMFEKYYTHNPTVGSDDIIQKLSQYINETRSALDLSDEARAEILHHYNVDSEKHLFYGKDLNSKIDSLIESLDKNKSFTVENLSKNIKTTNRIGIYRHLIHNKNIIRIRNGEYRLKPDTLL